MTNAQILDPFKERLRMKNFLISLLLFSVAATAEENKNLETLPIGVVFSQEGVSFVQPSSNPWQVVVQQPYKTTLATRGVDNSETLIAAIILFRLKEVYNGESFLSFIEQRRAEEPDTGRYGVLMSRLTPNNNRSEICVNHRSSSKDTQAIRNGQQTLFETYGMYCVHPHDNRIGVFIELSRKAPLDIDNPMFLDLGESLLKSVTFSEITEPSKR